MLFLVSLEYWKQPMHHKGYDLCDARNTKNSDAFQPTHPQGVRQLNRLEKGIGYVFQSTHPQGVRPGVILNIVSP